jgi:hypothetical protein
MKNGVFCDVTSCGSRNKRRFGGIYHLNCQGDKTVFLRGVLRLLVTSNVVPSSPNLSP